MSALEMFPEVVPTEDPNRRYTTAEFMAWIKRVAGVDAWDVDAAADAESHWAPRWFSLRPYQGSAGVDGLAQCWLPPRPPRFHDTCQTWQSRNFEHCARGDGIACPEDACDIDDGLIRRPWRIFVNPPFDDLGAWLAKVWAVIEEAARFGVELVIAFVLPGNRHEQPFWHEHVEPFRDGRAERFGYRLELHFPLGRESYAKPGSNGVAVGSANFPSALLVWRRA